MRFAVRVVSPSGQCRNEIVEASNKHEARRFAIGEWGAEESIGRVWAQSGDWIRGGALEEFDLK